MKKALSFSLIILSLILSTMPGQANGVAAISSTASGELPVLFGAYPSGSLQNYISELVAMDDWLTDQGASGVSLAGDFISITFNPQHNVIAELESAWHGEPYKQYEHKYEEMNDGFIPFLNLMPSNDDWEGSWYDPSCDTAEEIAAGSCDSHLVDWAAEFKAWARTGKQAFIAPLPEANGTWARYSTDGATFISAYRRIQTIFENQGVPDSAVQWVFAPNAWHDPDYPWQAFEYYYPGDAYVDVVSFSSYNYGGCPTSDWKSWDTYYDAFLPYLDRMRDLAPSKPIFIAQTGTVDKPVDDNVPTQNKSDWVKSTFGKLADYPGVRAIIYFNQTKYSGNLGNCQPADFRIYYPDTNTGEPGFAEIMADSRFGKWGLTDSKWENIAFANPSYTLADVMPAHPFADVPNVYYYDAVHTIYNQGLTGGCQTSPLLLYCPDQNVSRAEMAIFLERSIHGSGYAPPDADDGVTISFNDTINHWAKYWIEQLAADEITSGCGDGNYCPNNPVTRAQMALFLLKSKHGSGYTPPDVGDGVTISFNDTTTHWAKYWIEQLAAEGITSGCGGGNYCPDSPVSRDQMAVFLTRTFDLP